MQHIQYITSIIALCGLIAVSVYTVNHEDTVKMEIAAKSGLIQCREGSFVLWKKECTK
jgi:hypothetical protein